MRGGARNGRGTKARRDSRATVRQVIIIIIIRQVNDTEYDEDGVELESSPVQSSKRSRRR